MVIYVAAPFPAGLVASRKQDGVLYTHNDSGHDLLVFAIDVNGTFLASFRMENVTENEYHDFEDIAIGPGPNPTLDYLYVGNIILIRVLLHFTRIGPPVLCFMLVSVPLIIYYS